MSKVIVIKNLHKSFKMGDQTVRALNGIDLEIEQGSFTVVMGPSGSGKSTLLYLIGGLDKPTRGQIFVNDLPVDFSDDNRLAQYRRNTVGFIFQSFNLISNMTALENVSFPMIFSGLSRKKRKQRAVELLQGVGLEDRMKHKPTELSGGQQQRVAFARALVNEPALILADEPTGNLDSRSGQQILRMLFDHYQQGKTVLVVTHDERIRQFATNTIYILDGKIVDEEEYNASSSLLVFEDNQEE